MKKLFTFALTALFSVGLWANYAPTADEVIILNDVKSNSDPSYSTHAAIAWAASGASSNSKKAGDPNNNGAATSSNVPCYSIKGNGGNKNITVSIQGCSQIIIYHENHSSRYVELRDGSKSGDLIGQGSKATYFTAVDLDANTAYSIFLHGTTGTDDQDFYVYAVKLIKGATCEDPEASIAEDASIFIGDATDLEFASSNTSEKVYAVTLGDEAAAAEAYTIAEGKFTANVAGEFVITATQEADGTYCEVEESVTFKASAKTPVTSFEVEGPATAHIGEEVTLTAKNFDATPTSIQWLYVSEYDIVGEEATYTFTPDHAGVYEFYALARNEFNNPDDQEDDYQVAVYHAVTVAVGTDATLSDLKVNGTTVEGFDADILAYDLGEIGVYETLAVTATAADAPYAELAIVDNKAGTVTVTVTAEDETTIKEYVLTYARAAATELVAISESTTWDFTKTGSSNIQFTDETLVKKGVTEFNYADVLTNPDASFKAASLNGIAEYAVREGKYFQGVTLKFNTTVPGKLEVVYSNTGNREADKDLERILTVNGTKIGDGALRSDTDVTESDITIAAGEVVIKSVLKADDTEQYIRVKKVTFTKSESTALDNTDASVNAVKRLENGQLLIEKNGQVINVMGQTIR